MIDDGRSKLALTVDGGQETAVGDEVQLPMSIPVDSDGFLRQECPTCEREFKVWPSKDDEEPAPVPDGGYFCPYCGIQSEVGSWFTKAQIEQALAIAQRDVVEPMIEKFAQNLNSLSAGRPTNIRTLVAGA